jgi:hypothetical protein
MGQGLGCGRGARAPVIHYGRSGGWGRGHADNRAPGEDQDPQPGGTRPPLPVCRFLGATTPPLGPIASIDFGYRALCPCGTWYAVLARASAGRGAAIQAPHRPRRSYHRGRRSSHRGRSPPSRCRASLTVNCRPPCDVPCSPAIAALASAVSGISTGALGDSYASTFRS